ncbi:gap junction protein alpha 9a [Stegostoma tigrinum]|uniref:gap junction protein alpha 9a n=1 Tax=Stegostoma tigrinum TaxID=3053191 RepID=UPI00202B72DF|nr:gap junction protein alpha 9a [Stegostoma tigrinum]
MGDWNFLGGILEEVHVHSTIVGKIWLTILFIFRMLVLGVAAEDVWNDEQSEFICNTEQPGCRNVCYDKAFPISLIRYWVLQVIFVSSPSLVYMGHALYRLRALEKERQKKKVELKGELEETETILEDRRRLERELRLLERRKLNKAPLRGSLLRTYVLHILTRSVVEVGFMMGQFLLYGLELDPLYKCKRLPCPNIVDCFVSRPTEKSVFMLFMLCISAVSLFLNILEIIHLGCKKSELGLFGYYPKLKEDVGDICISKSQKNSSAQRISVSAAGHTHTMVPSAPIGYSLLLEKQAEATMYPIFTPPEFKPTQDDLKQSYKETQQQPPMATQYNADSNTALSCTEGPKKSSGSEVPSQKGEEWNEPAKTASLLSPNSHSASQMEQSTAGTLYPALHGAPFPPAISASASRKLRRVSATLSCATVAERSGSATESEPGHRGRCGFSVTRARTASKGDLKRPSRPDTPESICESSSESKYSGDGDSPQQALSPSRRMSLASNASGRRAPTDLQI